MHIFAKCLVMCAGSRLSSNNHLLRCLAFNYVLGCYEQKAEQARWTTLNLFHSDLQPRESNKESEDRLNEKMVNLLVKTRHGEHSFNILLHHSGPLADVDAIKELPDVLLSDCGGLLDQSR